MEKEVKSKYNLGFYGSGEIAGKIAESISVFNESIVKYGVASRNYQNALKFKKNRDIENVYMNYDEMLSDSNIDIIYISTPTAFHYEHVKACLKAGKHVMCEKPLTETYEQAFELFQLAESKKLVLLDGLWSMYMPIVDSIKSIVNENKIGRIKYLSASLGYPTINHTDKSIKYNLFDYEIYPLSFCLLILGDQYKKIKSKSKLFKDIIISNKSIFFYDQCTAKIRASLRYRDSNCLFILGEKGIIFSRNYWFGNKPLFILQFPFKFTTIKHSHLVNGYEYELTELLQRIKNEVYKNIQCGFINGLNIYRANDIIKKVTP